MRRATVGLVIAIVLVGGFAATLAWLFTDPKPPAGATRETRLYYAYCVQCHGTDGRGSWRAALFFIRPGDLTDAQRGRAYSDRYLFDLIKNGGASIGRPGMPAFGAQLSDDDITRLVAHVRGLSSAPASGVGR